MFLKKLTITKGKDVVREIPFNRGINFVVDETPTKDYITGNNVGKTTVLKLIDFCLGAKPNIIYTDTENKKKTYPLVKNYLTDNQILITLVLENSSTDKDKREMVIERNFLQRKKAIRKINGYNYNNADEFEAELLKLIIPEQKKEKPTFRQIISHNIRYSDDSLNNTLKTLNTFTTDVEYEALHLFMFGCNFENSEVKQRLITKLKEEEKYKSRLEKDQTKTAYETALFLVEEEIKKLTKQKENLNINENLEKDLYNLNQTKYQINKLSAEISNLCIRCDLIKETTTELTKSTANIDLKQLETIYVQATSIVHEIQKSFEDLVTYHNTMISEKIKFITNELPQLEKTIQSKTESLKVLLDEEMKLTKMISRSDSFDFLEQLIINLNDLFRKKGEYEGLISKISEVEVSINETNKELQKLDTDLFSDDFELKIKKQVNKFNVFFSEISNSLYGEQYAVKPDKVIKDNKPLYQFSAFNLNLSTGKKQGEILCFDVAYTLFADSEHISCLHFLLNDKKELMHNNQLVKFANYIKEKNIQFVASILFNKLPEELKKEENIAVRLSQNDKLFRIENG